MFRGVFLLLLCAQVPAADAPDWVAHGRGADKTYKYYVGRASRAPSEQAAFSDATRDAYETAIRENFGFQTRIQSDAYESSKQVVSTKRVQQLSQDIRVHGFEQVEFHREAHGEVWDVWVLYRYPLAEISREKSRLAGVKDEKPVDFSEQGTAAAAQTSGTLEVVSTPPGASVWVDGQSYGVTPMRLRGVLEAGRHKLRVDHPNHQAVEETVVLVPGNTLKVEKALVPAMAPLSITTEPSHANVVINGQQMGTTPLAGVEVPVNKPLKIEITHAEAHALATEFEAARDEHNTKHFELQLKNATLAIRTDPAGAEVFIDGNRAGVTPLAPKTLGAGRHVVKLRKAGFVEEQIPVFLAGAEKRVLDKIALQVAKPGAEPRVWTELTQAPPPRARPEHISYVLSFGLPHFVTSTIDYPNVPLATWGVGLMVRLWRRVGLDLGYYYGLRAVQFADAKVTLNSYRVHLGLPFFFYRTENSHAYVAPEAQYVTSRYTLRHPADTADQKGPGAAQWGGGLSVGYRHWWGGWPYYGLGARVGAWAFGGAPGFRGVVAYTGGLECVVLF